MLPTCDSPLSLESNPRFFRQPQPTPPLSITDSLRPLNMPATGPVLSPSINPLVPSYPRISESSVPGRTAQEPCFKPRALL